MKETLLQRCQREARDYANEEGMLCGCCDPECPGRTLTPEQIDDIIANTLRQAAEELGKMPALLVDLPTKDNRKVGVPFIRLTDAQKILLGEDNENV